MSTVYFVTDGEFLKIGWTAQPVAKRLSAIQNGNPRPLTLLATMSGSVHGEHAIHEKLKDSRAYGEWFFMAHERVRRVAELVTTNVHAIWAHLGIPENHCAPAALRENDQAAIDALRTAKKRLGLSAAKLALECDTDRRTVERWLSGERPIRLAKLVLSRRLYPVFSDCLDEVLGKIAA